MTSTTPSGERPKTGRLTPVSDVLADLFYERLQQEALDITQLNLLELISQRESALLREQLEP